MRLLSILVVVLAAVLDAWHAARRFHDAAVSDLRDVVRIVPGSVLPCRAGVTDLSPFVEVEAVSRQAVAAVGLVYRDRAWRCLSP